MRRLARPKPILIVLALIALIGAGAVAQHFRLFERAWFNWQEPGASRRMRVPLAWRITAWTCKPR